MEELSSRVMKNLNAGVRDGQMPAAYEKNKNRSNKRKIALLLIVVLIASVAYMLVNVNYRYFDYAMSIRQPKLIVMLIVAFAIGAATIVFQSIINNTIVTPCLLGMNTLYTMINTMVVFFFSTSSILYTNKNLSFAINLGIMSVAATFIYSWLFKKTKHNVLYVLLAGTVMGNFFSSVQSSMIRVMDPNEYDTLLTSLVASLSNVNSNIILLSLALILIVIFILRKELALLDVITLGKDQAINLGVDYDRTIRRLLLGVVILISIATAMIGPISFMGLIIANAARQLFKTYKHTYLIAGSALIGMVVMVGGQLIVEQIFVYSVPVSVFITVGGGIYFLYLLLRKRGV